MAKTIRGAFMMVVLTLAMVIGLVPALTPTALAAVTTTYETEPGAYLTIYGYDFFADSNTVGLGAAFGYSTVGVDGAFHAVNFSLKDASGFEVAFTDDFEYGAVSSRDDSILTFRALNAGSYSFSLIRFDGGGVEIDRAAVTITVAPLGDSIAPTVAITSAASSPTNTSPIPVTITFSESVTGFFVGDITVGNGTASNFSGSGTTYTVDITPTAQGTVTVDVAAGVATDAAGNSNTAATQLTRTYDSTAPTAPAVASAAASTNDTTPEWTWIAGGGGNGTYRYKLDDSVLTSGATETTTASYTPAIALSNGSHTLYVQERDAAGNWSTSGSYAVTIDVTAPTVSISSATSSSTNNAPISVTITFSEDVTGFVLGDITVGNGTASNFASTDAKTYTADITPSAQGAVTVNVAAGAATDAAGNSNTAATQLTRTYDNIAPTVSISSAAAATTNTSPISVTITFSESVTGFVVGDISVGNGTAGNFSGSGTTYTADITPTAQGAVTVNVAAGVAADAAGNSNTAATQLTRTYDSTAPTAPAVASAAATTNDTTPEWTWIAGGGGNGTYRYKLDDSTLTSGATETTTASYTPATALSAGSHTLYVQERDEAGNWSASGSCAVAVDATAPTVAITSAASSPTNSSPIPVTITFSEDVTGFVLGDITVGNGTASSFASTDAKTYTADITPTAQGVVTVNVAAGVAADAAGNSNTAATQLSRTYDSIAPTVSISSSAADPTNTAPISVTITFSESVTGFVLGDITVGNGSAGNFSGSGTTYTADITPAAQGAVTVDVVAGVAVDAASNNNTASTQITRTYDSVAPTAPAVASATATTNDTTPEWTWIAGGGGNGTYRYKLDDSNLTSGATETTMASYTPATAVSAGSHTLYVQERDEAGNWSASGSYAVTIDVTAPTVSISSAAAATTNAASISVTITFSESVTGFVVGDITVGNGTAGNFSGSGTTYTVDITPTAQGTVTVNVAAGVATDAAGNSNTAATQLTRTYDNIAPTVTITSAASSSTNTSPIPVTITFSESVTGFVLGDITVGNGSASNSSGSETTYTADITPSVQGAVTVDVAAGVAVDAAGNSNTAATPLTRTYDSMAPTAPAVTAAPATTNDATPEWTWISGGGGNGTYRYKLDESTLTSGATETTTASYTPAIALSAGSHTLYVQERDEAGNWSTSGSYAVTVDVTAPTVSISSATSSSTNNVPISVTITFSEDVTGFVVGDITVGNGTAGNLASTDAKTYTADITPTTQGAVTVDVAAGVAVDAASNSNTAATQFTRTYDSIAPTVTITSAASSSTNTSPIPVTITFSESVTGFVLGDITVGNGSASNFGGSGTTYTADITPSAQGAVTVHVAAAVAVDAAGNSNTAATQLSRTYDSTAPTAPAVTSAGVMTNDTTPEWTWIAGGGGNGTYRYKLDDSTLTSGATETTTASYTPAIALSAGSHTLYVQERDAAGNWSTSGSYAVTIDVTAPTATITSAAASFTNTSPIPVTITFSEDVTGFVLVDITVENGTASNLAATDAKTYTVDVIPSAQGPVTVNVAASVATDAAGNSNTAAAQLSRTYDSVAPTVAITSAASNPTNTSPIPVTITFSENVTGFVVGDITVGNGTASNFAATDAKTYTAGITPTAQGAVTVDVAAGVAVDAASNSNTAATQLTITYDSTAPTAPAVASVAATTNDTMPEWTWISGGGGNGTYRYKLDDSTLTSGATETTTASYTPATVLSAGSHTLYVQERDEAGNWSASGSYAVVVDVTAPTVAITSAAASSTSTSPMPVTITFSENVTGFAVGDITVGNGTAGNFSGSGTTYTADVTPTAQGAVTVNVATGVATDAAGNSNTAATQLSRTYDSIVPTITSATVSSDYAYVDLTFSEGAYGDGTIALATGDLTLTFLQRGGTATNVTISSIKKSDNAAEASASALTGGETTVRVFLTVTGTPSGPETITITPVSGSAIHDAAGNSMASTQTTGAKQLYIPISDDGDTGPTTNNGAVVIVNGEPETAGTAQTTTNSSGQTVTTVTVDSNKLESILSSESSGATVTIPITGNSDVAAGTLTGAMVKSMENKDATLVVQTDSGTYTLPASEINIDAVSQQFGTDVSLAEINVTVSISEPSAIMTQVIVNAAQDGGLTIMVPAVDYTITCTYGDQTVQVSAFNSYVERRIAIPEGVDPSRITTGIVVDPDGTTRHVPTAVTQIDGVYYAIINSLTNSTYTVIWHPLEFPDMASHWAKDPVNDMASRLVMDGDSATSFGPNRAITRGEFAATVVKALGLAPATGESPFVDLTSADPYYGYILTAHQYGILHGNPGNLFLAENTITRQEAMSVIVAAMRVIGARDGLTATEVTAVLSVYSDSGRVGGWARGVVADCLRSGIIGGRPGLLIAPRDNLTRAETAAIVQRLLRESGLI